MNMDLNFELLKNLETLNAQYWAIDEEENKKEINKLDNLLKELKLEHV